MQLGRASLSDFDREVASAVTKAQRDRKNGVDRCPNFLSLLKKSKLKLIAVREPVRVRQSVHVIPPGSFDALNLFLGRVVDFRDERKTWKKEKPLRWVIARGDVRGAPALLASIETNVFVCDSSCLCGRTR